MPATKWQQLGERAACTRRSSTSCRHSCGPNGEHDAARHDAHGASTSAAFPKHNEHNAQRFKPAAAGDNATIDDNDEPADDGDAVSTERAVGCAHWHGHQGAASATAASAAPATAATPATKVMRRSSREWAQSPVNVHNAHINTTTEEDIPP